MSFGKVQVRKKFGKSLEKIIHHEPYLA